MNELSFNNDVYENQTYFGGFQGKIFTNFAMLLLQQCPSFNKK